MCGPRDRTSIVELSIEPSRNVGLDFGARAGGFERLKLPVAHPEDPFVDLFVVAPERRPRTTEGRRRIRETEPERLVILRVDHRVRHRYEMTAVL